jgi:hypothetical protein
MKQRKNMYIRNITKTEQTNLGDSKIWVHFKSYLVHMPVQGMTYEYDVVIAAAGTCHLLNIFGAKFKLEPIDGVCVVHFPAKFTLHICICLISADIILACMN